MTWQTAITLQVIVSSFMTIFTRHLTLSVRRVFFGVGVVSYLVVAVMGCAYSLVANHGIPPIPHGHAWAYILIEGISIPAAWLIQYKTISYVGAGNAVVISTLNTAAAAALGILLLHDNISSTFVLGSMLVVTSALLSLGLRADTNHQLVGTFWFKLLLISAGALLFGIGMFAEKQAITSISVWNYSFYGWSMQAVGALLLFGLFGKSEIRHLTPTIAQKGAVLGLITSVAGGLYIYALSKGQLSHTIIAASGKVAITVLLAALLLGERNAIRLRATAFVLSVIGLWLIIG